VECLAIWEIFTSFSTSFHTGIFFWPTLYPISRACTLYDVSARPLPAASFLARFFDPSLFAHKLSQMRTRTTLIIPQAGSPIIDCHTVLTPTIPIVRVVATPISEIEGGPVSPHKCSLFEHISSPNPHLVRIKQGNKVIFFLRVN